MNKMARRLFEGVWLALGVALGFTLLRTFHPGGAQESGEGGLGSEARDLQARLSQELYLSRQTAITRAVALVEPAVVGINVIQIQRWIERSPFRRDPFWGQFFPDRIVEHPVENLGSGFIISEDGLTLTNEHVVHNAKRIVVTLPDGREVDAELLGADYNSDIALLDLEGEGYPYIEIGDSERAMIGEWVIALGNPYGLFASNKPSVTVGVISAVDRDFGAQENEPTYKNMIQTDAAINPGNSGGPLVNALGEAIGMNTMIYSRSGGSVGLGFAIPVNHIRDIVADLRATGQVDRDIWTGIWIRDLNRRMAMNLGYRGGQGVVVVELNPGSPAEDADLRVSDIILSINGHAVDTCSKVKQIIADEDIKVGDRMVLEVFRGGRILTIAMTAGARRTRSE